MSGLGDSGVMRTADGVNVPGGASHLAAEDIGGAHEVIRAVDDHSNLVSRQREVDHVTLGQHVGRGRLETQLRQRAGELRVRRAGGGLGGLERGPRFAVRREAGRSCGEVWWVRRRVRVGCGGGGVSFAEFRW